MTFSDLDDAFHELERRADAADDLIAVPGLNDPRRRHPSSPVRIGAVAATVAAVAAVAAVVAGMGYTSTGRSHHLAGAGTPPTHSIAAPVRTSTTPTTPGTAKRPAASATDVPKTQAALIARFRSILGGTATFTVDSANSSDNLITGVLTSAAGTRGLYVLELDKDVAICGTMKKIGQTPTLLPCPHPTTLADGSKLKVDPTYPDGPPNGVMNDAILSRPDGWQISLYTANVQGKYPGTPVLGKEPALTTAEVTDVVTSPAWLVK